MTSSVVLITGALTGIGRAAALAFARDGARVVVSGRRDDAGQTLVTELRALDAEAEFVRTDVRHEEEVRTLIERAVERFGRLDVAVNNAGTEGGWRSALPRSARTSRCRRQTPASGAGSNSSPRAAAPALHPPRRAGTIRPRTR
jgi:NAD(P)-dependent dehydrogenase (short-subunit alcohol dehydrogenase family)